MAYEPRHIINVHTHHHRGRDFEEHLAEWTRDGATVTCVACVGREWREAGYDLFDNDDLLPWLRKYPDRLIGMAFMRTTDPVDGAKEVRRRHEEGFRGIKIICPDAPYHDPRYWPIYEQAQALRMPILFHTGLVAGRRGTALHAKSYSEYMRPYYLENVARRFPDLRIIAAHLGKPHVHEAFNLLEVYENVYFDMSGGSASRRWLEDILRAMLPRPGADMTDPDQNPALRCFAKMCFATDNPSVAKWRAGAEYILDALEVPPDLREAFYWRNAARLFELSGLLDG